MRIFKFGGASVKNKEGVLNVLKTLEHEGIENTLVVVSAMGKMTNAFEKLLDAYLKNNGEFDRKLKAITDYHLLIAQDLFVSNHPICDEIGSLIIELKTVFESLDKTNYNFAYDQTVCYGELLSTKIIAAFLQEKGIASLWLDIRNIIKTDNTYRNANVDWDTTSKNCADRIDTSKLVVTQGFISSSISNYSTTLGREGSDYTAGIIAYCLNASSVTIWKDVSGVLNADPRAFTKTTLLTQISYQEAIEMSFYGASVIHPKTLKPLENKRIPLFVRSFVDLQIPGTKVSKGVTLEPETPCFIVKESQILVSISANDFSFMVEENISHIFKLFHEFKLKVNLIQNSAISFSVCLEDNFNKFEEFYKYLSPNYKIKYNSNVTLYTIRHFDNASLKIIEEKGDVLLKQISRETAQLVIK